MEAMYNEMVRLGIDEYNTNFLVAGIDTIEALLKLTDEELSEMGIESVEQRTHVLAQLQLVKGEGALSQASAGTSEQATAEDMFASIEQADLSLDSAVSFEEAAAHTDALWNELRATPPAAAPAAGPPSAGTPPASSDELAQLRIAASRALREQLERTQQELVESIQVNVVLEEKIAALSDSTATQDVDCEKIVSALKKKHSAALAAAANDLQAKLTAVEAELETLKAVSEVRSQEAALCMHKMEVELDREREGGRAGLRSELDEFMIQVSSLTDHNEALTKQLSESEARAAECGIKLAEAEKRSENADDPLVMLQKSQDIVQDLEGKLAERAAYIEQFQEQMESQLIECRKTSREAEAKSTAEVVKLQQEKSELTARLQSNGAASEEAANRSHARLSKLQEQHATELEELQDQLTSSLSDLQLLSANGANETAVPDCMLQADVYSCVEQAFGKFEPAAAETAVLQDQTDLASEEEVPADGAQKKKTLTDRIFGAMEFMMPYDQ